MTGRRVLLAGIASLAAGLLLASAVSAAVRHTEPLAGSFIATAKSDQASSARVMEFITSDLNGDGVIDRTDLLSVVASLGDSSERGGGSSADLNGDGTVDVRDLALLAKHYGAPTSSQDD